MYVNFPLENGRWLTITKNGQLILCIQLRGYFMKFALKHFLMVGALALIPSAAAQSFALSRVSPVCSVDSVSSSDSDSSAGSAEEVLERSGTQSIRIMVTPLSSPSPRCSPGIYRISAESPKRHVVRAISTSEGKNLEVTLRYEESRFGKTSKSLASIESFRTLEVTRFESLNEFAERLLALVLEKSKITKELIYKGLDIVIEGYDEKTAGCSWQYFLSQDSEIKRISLVAKR